MNKKYLISLIAFLLIICFGIWYYRSKPNMKEIERNTEGWYLKSEVPNRKNYKKLVRFDKRDNKTFLTREAWYCIVVNNTFPYTEKKLGGRDVDRVIEILNDSSSYTWEELGTPQIDKTIIYYGKIDEPVGYTELDFEGEVENYPYRSLMKWGRLKRESMDELVDIIK